MKLHRPTLAPVILTIGVAVFAALGARAKDVYVAKDGHDDNSGEAGAPVATVARALEALNGEDGTVHIGPGTFPVNVALTLNAAVQIVGAGPGQTIITREGQTYRTKKLFILTNEGALVDNLTIKDVYAQDVGGTSGAIIEFPNTTGKGKVSRLVVEGCTAGSSAAGYVCYIGSNASAEVEDVIFRNNSMRDSGGSGVLYANGATSAKVKNCAFIGNSGYTTGAIRIYKNCEVVKCTFADNRTNFTTPANARGGAVYMQEVANKKTILSNCVFFADHAWYDTTPMSPEVYYSSINATLTNCFFDCAWDAKVPAIGKGAVSITESEFTDVYSGDYRPHLNSKLIVDDVVLGGLDVSEATGPAFTPTGPAEIALALGDSINEAIKAAPEGQVINLAEGIYSVTGTLWIAKGITLKGAGRDKTFLMRNGSTYDSTPYLRLEHADAAVCGVTISNVNAKANNQAGVLFITAQGGAFADSRITKCNGAGSGSGTTIGLAGGRLHHTIINNNTLWGSSGNSTIYLWGGQVDNCLVCKNGNITRGCVALRGPGKIYNCTFVDNTVRNADNCVCAGVYWNCADNFDPRNARIVNTIFTRGTAAKDTSTGHPEWYRNGGTEAQFSSCFSHCGWGSGVPVVGEGSVAVTDDGFVDAANGDYHLKTTSAAYEKGTADEGVDEMDLDGNDRVRGDLPDIGCYEAEAGQLTVGIKVAPTAGFVGEAFHCTPIITGMPAGKSYTCKWTFRNESDSESDIVSTQAEYDQVFATAGTRSVYLAVYGEGGELLMEAEPELNYVRVGVRTCYLAAMDDDAVTPTYPYDTPETAAKTNLAAMVEASVPGQGIVLGKGCIDAGGVIDISGLKVVGQGWDSTVLTNAPLNAGEGRYPQECFIKLNLAGSLLDNLCVSNVLSYFNNASLVTVDASGGTVSRVKFVGCRGGGASNGYVIGLYGPDSLVTRCIFENCEVQPNSSCGCIYASNGSRVDNTLVDGTRGLYQGAGIITEGAETTILNCTVARNQFGYFGNGSATGFLIGNAGSKFVNCVSVCNAAPTDPGLGGSAWQGGGSEAIRANCVSNCAFSADAALTGTGCVLIEDVGAAFRNADRGDFRPRRNSPCVDSGLDVGWTNDDRALRGERRVVNGAVDIGCYEFPWHGLMLMVK